MTFRELLDLLREYAEGHPDAESLDREVVVRVATDEGGDLVVGGLREVSIDAGCTDEEALVLDADDRESEATEEPDPDPGFDSNAQALVVTGTHALVARPDRPRILYRMCATCWRELAPGAAYVRDQDMLPICLACAPLWLTHGQVSLVVLRCRVGTRDDCWICWANFPRCTVKTSGATASRTSPGWWTSRPLRCVLPADHAPGCVF